MFHSKHTRWTIALTLVSLLMSTMALAHPSERGVGAANVTFSNAPLAGGLDSDSDDDSDRRGRRGRRHRGNDSDDDSDRRGRRRRDRDRDDDSDFRGRRRRVRDRDDDFFNRGEVRRLAVENGFREGFRAGRNDRANGRDFDFRDHGAFRDATIGFRREFGDVDFYRRNFREGFRQGYEDGFDGRNQRRRRGDNTIGDIIGGVFGRP